MTLPFLKMHGLGNDFVVVDARDGRVVTAELARALGDRRRGVGCDQILVLETPKTAGADVFMRIFNPDGSMAEACGNGTRCVAGLTQAESGRPVVTVETVAGLLRAERGADGMITVDMGPAVLDWAAIPVAREVDTLRMPVEVGPLAEPVGMAIGNPHATFFVPDAEAIDVARFGPEAERHPLFPRRANIGVASLLGPDHLRLRMWERGAGVTQACGSGACAAAVAAARRALTGRRVRVTLDGGDLWLEWRDDGHVLMTGPIATSFSGVWPLAGAA